jgi:hypothetical protein
VEYGVHLAVHVKALADVPVAEPESRVLHQMLDVVQAGCQEIVHTHHITALGEQSLAQVGADEPGPAGHYCTHNSPLALPARPTPATANPKCQ